MLTLNPHIHQKSQKISNYYINDQTLLRIIKLLYKRTLVSAQQKIIWLNKQILRGFLMSMALTVNSCTNDIVNIISKLELVASEFAFNLEIVQFHDVLELHGIREDEFEKFYLELTTFLSHCHFTISDKTIIVNAKHAHRLLTDCNCPGPTRQLKLLSDCYEWLMPLSTKQVFLE